MARASLACQEGKEGGQILDQAHKGQGVEDVDASRGGCEAPAFDSFKGIASLEESVFVSGMAKMVHGIVSYSNREKSYCQCSAQNFVQGMAGVGG